MTNRLFHVRPLGDGDDDWTAVYAADAEDAVKTASHGEYDPSFADSWRYEVRDDRGTVTRWRVFAEHRVTFMVSQVKGTNDEL